MRTAIALLLLVTGCGNVTRLTEVGRPPSLSPMSDPTREPGYRPLTMPMPAVQRAEPQDNALWRNGSRAFFKDQRAAQVGDILTVLVEVNDNAALKNSTTTARSSTGGMGLTKMFGLEGIIPTVLGAGVNPASLISSDSKATNTGSGELKRTDALTVKLAGVVTQVLPNGNLVIAARQEVRVGSELRELAVAGVIRPQDIASDNTVKHDRMAEARIAYGGRGQLTDQQSPRWGQQIVDQITPF